jgi:hypothetical protein
MGGISRQGAFGSQMAMKSVEGRMVQRSKMVHCTIRKRGVVAE